MIALIKSHLTPYRRQAVLIVVLATIQTAASLTLPSISADIIDKGVLPGDNGYIHRMGLWMLMFAVVQIVFFVAMVYVSARTAMSIGRDLRNDLFHRVTDFSAREVGHFGSASLITRITNDVQQVQQLAVLSMTMMIQAPITIVVGVIMAVRQDVGLSAVLVVIMPLSAILLGSVVARMVPAYQRMQDHIDHVNRVLREQISGLRVVRAFVREPEEVARFEDENVALTKTSLTAGRLSAAMYPTVVLIVNLSSVVVLWFGGARVGSGDLQIGTLIAYLSYLVQILMAVVMATFMVSQIPRAAVAADRIHDVLSMESSVAPPDEPVADHLAVGSIELRDVSFHYPGADFPVLSHVSFRVEPGTTTAIIGSTGAGKSTLVSLVPRLFDATDGTVLVDGVDVRDFDLEDLWSRVGLVPQRSYLFSGTVRSNLEYGRPGATDDEMWSALNVAQAADFVAEMPGGLDATVAQGGANLSGGQKQRLAIARALIRRPTIYLFDDSFSALDVATDARLRAALASYSASAACIVVAQRVSTIIDADQIVVLDDGRVVGLGTHDELVATCPTYAEIVDSQIGAAVGS